MQEVYKVDSALYLQVPVKLPSEINNKLTVVIPGGEYVFPFIVDVPSLELTSMFNEYAPSGDTTTIYGKFFELYEIDSLSAVVSFGGKEKPVIKSGDTYVTVQVPEGLGVNTEVKLISKLHETEATLPSFYKDQRHIMTTFDSDYPNMGGHPEYVGTFDEEKPMSGNYIRLKDPSGWWYLFEMGVTYTRDMILHPENYEVRFELRMHQPIMKSIFYIYFYWAISPEPLGAEYFKVQSTSIWQTVGIPLDKIIPEACRNEEQGLDNSFNIRVENYDGTMLMDFDNFRIAKKGSTTE